MFISLFSKISIGYACSRALLKTKALHKMSTRYSSDYDSFNAILNKSNNIVVLTGAGVSAESGIPTFRGAGGLWRTFRAADLATPTAFRANPSLVWEFYHYRREVAFNSQPNNVSFYSQAKEIYNTLFSGARLTRR